MRWSIRYAKSGTGIAYAGILLCAAYAMSGTETSYAGILLRARYAMSGSEAGPDAPQGTGAPKSNALLVHVVRGERRIAIDFAQRRAMSPLSRWVMSGTEIADQAHPH
eukprot:1595606-Rhodomonas_salina.1